MSASIVEGAVETVGPFAIPVVVFAFGAAGYFALWLYFRWRDGEGGR